MNKKIFILIIIPFLILSGIVLYYRYEYYAPLRDVSPCKLNIPLVVYDDMNNPLGSSTVSDPKVFSIIDNKRSDLYSPRYGIIESIKGWSVDVKYQPYLEYENINYIFINNGTDIDKMRIWLPVRYFYYVIRKLDGKIISRNVYKINFVRSTIVDDVFYGKEGVYDNNIYCIKVGE